jgi:hypothetical protein
VLLAALALEHADLDAHARAAQPRDPAPRDRGMRVAVADPDGGDAGVDHAVRARRRAAVVRARLERHRERRAAHGARAVAADRRLDRDDLRVRPPTGRVSPRPSTRSPRRPPRRPADWETSAARAARIGEREPHRALGRHRGFPRSRKKAA